MFGERTKTRMVEERMTGIAELDKREESLYSNMCWLNISHLVSAAHLDIFTRNNYK